MMICSFRKPGSYAKFLAAGSADASCGTGGFRCTVREDHYIFNKDAMQEYNPRTFITSKPMLTSQDAWREFAKQGDTSRGDRGFVTLPGYSCWIPMDIGDFEFVDLPFYSVYRGTIPMVSGFVRSSSDYSAWALFFYQTLLRTYRSSEAAAPTTAAPTTTEHVTVKWSDIVRRNGVDTVERVPVSDACGTDGRLLVISVASVSEEDFVDVYVVIPRDPSALFSKPWWDLVSGNPAAVTPPPAADRYQRAASSTGSAASIESCLDEAQSICK